MGYVYGVVFDVMVSCVYIYISDSSDRVHEMTRSVFLRTGLPGFAGTQVKRSRIWLSKSCEF